MAVIVLSVLQIVRADARVGRGREDVAAMNSVADAAVNISILALLGPQATQPPVNSVPFNVPFAGYTTRVLIQDEAGKIDLNMASDIVLHQLLIDAGLDTGAATAVTSNILAWRGTRGDSQNIGGDASSIPHKSRLQSVEELQLVPGVTPGLYREIEPLVTVYSQTPWIDPVFSSLEILNVFRSIDSNAEAVWRRREEQRAGVRPADPNPGVALGHAFTITAEVTGPASARVIRTAVIRLTGQAQVPLLVYRWN